MAALKGQEELDQYKLTKREIARYLGISTNAVRMSMRGKNCHDLQYRFDGKQYLFKVPQRDPVTTMIPDHPSDLLRTPKSTPTTHKKIYNRGATARGEDNYTSDALRMHNEAKMRIALDKKFKNEAHKKVFMDMSEAGFKEAYEISKGKAEKASNQYHGRPKYGGMVYGYSAKQWDRPYDLDGTRPPSSSFNTTGKAFCGYGNSEQMPEEKEEVAYIWNEPKIKDPGADYKPGRFKHLDEAIRNTRKK